MRLFGIDFGAVLRGVFRPTNIPAATALLGIVLAGGFADYQGRLVQEQRQRADVAGQVSVIRAKLEGNINGNIQLVRGLIATLATEPDMTQARFSDLASKLFANQSQLRDVTAAPDLVVKMVYPMAGNEGLLGLDYHTIPAQRDAAAWAQQSGRVVLAGPLDLLQGGQGFVAKMPVFVDEPNGEKQFWGIVSAIVDVNKLYQDSGLNDPDLDIEIALRGRNSKAGYDKPFYGRSGIFDDRAVMASIALLTGGWQIAAIPRGGWGNSSSNWLVRLAIVIAGLLVFVPIAVAGRLAEERHQHMRELAERGQQLDQLSRRLELALDTSKIGVWAYNIETDELVWDTRMNELYGLADKGGRRSYVDWRRVLHPDDLLQAEGEFAEAIRMRGDYHSEFRVLFADGTVRHLRAIGAVYGAPDGTFKMIGVNWDVSSDVILQQALTRANALTEARNLELEAAKASIEYNSLHDPLTGLPNRRYLDELLARHRASETGVAILHIDLDRFKQINDTLGHAAGDAMLVHAAEVLRSNIDPGEFVARIGGDEFVIVTDSGLDTGYLAALADRIVRQMRKPVFYQGHECRFGVSVGIASAVGDGIDAHQLLVDADIALYRAKSRGRNRYEFFTEALQAEIITTKRVADEILSGIERNEFVAHYQPQFDAQTLDIIGVEALVRWQHAEKGILQPDNFLPIAEELNVVGTIDRLVLEDALRHFKTWRRLGLNVPQLSVNVSSRRLREEDLIPGLRELQIEPGTVAFELVESIYLDDSDEEDDAVIAWNIDRIKELGIAIEIDDFGTGYASIVSLLKLKPSRLKIDRQLVIPVVDSPAQRHLLASIIDIGGSLGIETVAEGVETYEHARILAELGVDALQGFAFARAMSAEELERFISAQAWRAA